MPIDSIAGVVRNHSRRFICFGVIGAANSALDIGLFYLLAITWQGALLAANTCAYLVAASSSYFLNRLLTFKDRRGPHSVTNGLARFLVVAAIGLLLSNLLVWLLTPWTGPMLGKLLSIGVVMFWNYSASLMLVFNKA